MYSPVPAAGRMIGRSDIMGVRDRAPNAMLFQRKRLTDAITGVPVAEIVTSLMLRGQGGSGEAGDAPVELATLPARAPDSTLDIASTELQPLIYRLSGDYNPLHIDPAVAQAAGFSRPILHGLASMGLATYAILRHFCDFDPTRLKALSLRFSRPVLPGDTLRFDVWQMGGTLRFAAFVAARDVVVIDRGTAEIA